MEKRDTVSLALWVPGAVARIVDNIGQEGDSQCEKYRRLLIQAIDKYVESPGAIPVRLLKEDARRMRVTIPITISRADYTRLTDLANKTGLSKKKLGEILICGEIL